jgi:hypothetical protein
MRIVRLKSTLPPAPLREIKGTGTLITLNCLEVVSHAATGGMTNHGRPRPASASTNAASLQSSGNRAIPFVSAL